jgi:hypothetical protein
MAIGESRMGRLKSDCNAASKLSYFKLTQRSLQDSAFDRYLLLASSALNTICSLVQQQSQFTVAPSVTMINQCQFTQTTTQRLTVSRAEITEA